ncbi:MAG: hypothetical protein QOJ15_1287 [Bradyrhizobium sp.]|jgi:hypothetical protein|nr:hypothetical protein [Bradyrhizobium sp.]
MHDKRLKFNESESARHDDGFRLADRPADYKRLGIVPVEIAEFEDGQRIGTEKGHYEWWYFDAHLDNGATVVVVFYTKPNVSPNGPLAPRITINITLPDGRTFDKFLDTRPELFTASKSGCDVRIGTNRFVGDLNRYHITADIEEISVEIELTGEVPAWRPKSGHLYFGAEGREQLFAWLPAVPHGPASVRYRIGDEQHRASGSGYHDHNWGDVPMQTLMHNWYWARASAGPYTIIASYITATAAYRYKTQIVYMLAKDGKIIADDDAKVSFESDRVATDSKTGKPVADVTRYTYHDADTSYVVSFERQTTILQAILTDRAPLLKRIIARLIGFDGAYHRFTGKVTIEKFEDGVPVERFDDRAIWELMYFGRARPSGVEIQ